MNVHSLSNRSPQFSGGSRRQDSKSADSLLSFKIPHLSPILPDDATRLGPDMAPALVHQSAADWVVQQTARSKQSRSNLQARKRQFP
jgi:hypothetical protein